MKIHYHPHPILSYKCKPLIKVDTFIKDVASKMLSLLSDTTVGLAATQVGLPYRFFVTCLDECSIVINPVIYGHGGLSSRIEGCVSLPGLQLSVRRNNKIKLDCYNLNGDNVKLNLEGLKARICLHELDHCDGIMITDRAKDQNHISSPILEELHNNFANDFNHEEWLKTVESFEKERCLLN